MFIRLPKLVQKVTLYQFKKIMPACLKIQIQLMFQSSVWVL